MTKTKHKILSVFLSLCMIISCMVGMSVTAGAVVSPSVALVTSGLSGSGNITADNFYQDFVGVTEEEAKAWTGASATGYSVLWYKIDGTTLHRVIFYDGNYFTTGGTGMTIYDWNNSYSVCPVYYTTGSGSSSTPETETLLTTITATGQEQANYSTANVATVSFSYTAGGSSAYLANWGWWGYGWTATVTPAEGYTITKCIFYDDANRTATDSEAPFVVETTEEDKTPRINGTPIDGGNMQSKGITKIEVYGYVTPAPAWTNGNVTATLDGTKLTVEKTAGAENGDMGTGWTKVGSAPAWSTIKATITEVEIKDGVTSIGDGAFLYCSKLASVTIPSSVTSIGDSAFNNCSTLTSVTIPDSVTSIEIKAFNGCSNLTSVTFIPGTADATLSIGVAAFHGTKSGATVAYGTGDTVLYDNDTQITTETLLTAIENKTLTWKAASSTPAWTNGNVTATLDGTKLTVAKTDNAENGNMGTSWVQKSPNTTTWASIKGTITEVEIQDGVTSIGDTAFLYCSALTSVTIPSSVTSIGISSFFGCSALTSVTIPSSVTSIGNAAFYYCTALTSVTIPNSVTSIGLNTFKGCSNLTSVTFIPGTAGATLSIGESAFKNTKSGATVAYGTGDTVLYDNTTEIKAGDALTTIYSTSAEKTLTWKATSSTPAWTNGNVIGILDGTKLTVAKKDGAQNGDMGNEWTAVTEGGATWDSKKATITEVEIQDGVTSIGNEAFHSCSKLASVSIPDSVTSIGNDAFSSCSDLTSVTIPSSVTSIGSFAFYYCGSLTSVTIPSSVTSIGIYAFSGSKLASVTIPNSVTSIGVGSFQACTSLTSVKFNPGTADATLSIGMDAFSDTANGAKVAYGTGDTVLYDDETKITTDTLLTDIQDKTLTWKEPTYNITFDNGGTAKVDGTVVTSAAEGATVTIVADEPAPGTEFNGWTSTSEGVTFADADLAETTFRMPASDVEITASYQNIAYKITMRNGGTAYVDGEPATTAEAGTVVTIKAKSSVSTPARFNGWTTTTEGVEFADADSVETTFVMPISDVTITASFEGVTPYVPSHSPSNTSTTTTTTANAPAETMTFEGEETISHTNLLSWSSVSGASSYLISVKTDGKFVPLATTTKTNIDVVHAYNGKYYVSEGGRYTAYTYKDGKFVKGGTITAAQADKLVKANNVTDTYMLQYTKNGKLSSEKSALTVSVKVYYKPAVKASSKDGKVILKWKKVVGAEKYRVYKYEGGKLTKIADTTANAVRISKVTAGKTYKYAVKAYVDGKWTKVTKSDIVSVKVK